MKYKTGCYQTITVITLYIILAACKKSNDSASIGYPPSFAQIFDDYWHKMSQNYVYWNIDTTNWDAIYNSYKQAFDHLDVTNSRDVQQSVKLFREMTQGLTDGHYYIKFSNQALLDSIVYPAFDQKKNKATYHNVFPYSSITIKYLDPGYYEGSDTIGITEGEPLYALCGTIQNRCLYFYCNRFALLRAWSTSSSNKIKTLLSYFISSLHNMPTTIKKVIIDLRGNRGGDISDLNFLCGQFINSSMVIGYTRYKSNRNRLDYTPWIQASVTPQPGANPISGKIIVLTDNFTASLAELVTFSIKTLPNGIIIGENTWGANGPLTANYIYNDGSFDVSDFMHVETASAQFKYIDGKMYEGIGITPDITVPYNFVELNSGIDAGLEKALNE